MLKSIQTYRGGTFSYQFKKYAMVIATIAAGIAIFMMLSAARTAPASAIEPDGFVCDGTFYQTRYTTGDATRLYRINRDTTPYTTTEISTIASDDVNGIAYDVDTGYIHGWVAEANTLLTINNTGAVIDSRPVAGLPPATITAAAIDANGIYYGIKTFVSGTELEYYTVDLNQPTLTATLHTLTGTGSVPITEFTDFVGDMVLDPTAPGVLYGIMQAKLIRINTNNNTISIVGDMGDYADIGIVGSVFIDTAGAIYAYSNSGAFYQVSKANGAATLINTAPATFSSDGASCGFEQASIDTVKSVNGAVQQLGSASFRIPYTVRVGNTSVEAVTLPNVQLTEALNRTFVTGSPTITVSTAPAITQGDCTANASFNGLSDTRLLTGTDSLDQGETCAVSFAVDVTYPSVSAIPEGPQNNTVYASSSSHFPNNGYTFVGNTPVPPIQLIASDLSSDSSTLPVTTHADTPNPTPVVLATPAFATGKSVSPATGTALAPGATATYTLTATNNGNVNLTTNLTDSLADVLDNSTIVNDSLTVASSRAGASPAAPVVSGTTLTWSGTLQPGETVTITYQVLVGQETDGEELVNRLTSTATTPGNTPVASPCATGSEAGCTTQNPIVEPPVAPAPEVPNTGALSSPTQLLGALALGVVVVLAAIVSFAAWKRARN